MILCSITHEYPYLIFLASSFQSNATCVNNSIVTGLFLKGEWFFEHRISQCKSAIQWGLFGLFFVLLSVFIFEPPWH